MRRIVNIIRWNVVAMFGLMSIYALSEGGFLGALLFFLGGLIVAPLGFVKKLRSKLKLNNVLSIVLIFVLLFGGLLVTPTSEILTDNMVDSQISGTVYDETDETEENNETSKPLISETTPEETIPEQETEPEQETTSESSTSGVGTGQSQTVNPSDIPAYSGKAYVTINDNIPGFSSEELKSTGYETYSNLDSLGRTKTAVASVGKDTMPKEDEERGSISSIKPTGWKQAKYDCVSGGWLYNRCHLIGWQLSAENANPKNLITGTKYLNVEGMLPFENMVADYIKETGNHVAYRITPIYQGDNLLASGIQMEAYSVEDKGEGICFNIYCYNVQPDVTIDYTTGASSGESVKEETVAKPESSLTQQQENIQQNNNSQTVYTTKSGKRYHITKDCSGLNNAKAIYDSTLSKAKGKNLTPCKICCK